MNQYEIYLVFEEAREKDFLDMIVFLKSEEKKYKESEIYKVSKIPLLELFKNYCEFEKSKINIIEDYIRNLNKNTIAEAIVEIIEYVNDSEKIGGLLKTIEEKFDLEKLLEDNEEIFNFLGKFK